MWSRILVGIIIGLALSACQNSVPSSSETKTQSKLATLPSENLTEWLDAQFETQLQFSPIYLTFLGRKDRYGEIDDMSEEAETKHIAWHAETVKAMKQRFDYDSLSDDEKLSYDLWIYQYEESKANEAFLDQGYVFHQMSGPQAFLPQFMINFHSVEEASDMEAYNQRLIGAGRALGQLLERAKRYAEAGTRPPRFAYEAVIEQSNNITSGKPFDTSDSDSPLWADAKRKISELESEGKIDSAAAKELLATTRQALIESIQPAYLAIVSWVESDIDNAQVNPTGVGQRERGLDYYNERLAKSTTTQLTADQVHEIGLREVERLTQEMEALKNKVGFEGELQDFFKFIKDDDRFYYPNTDEGRLGYIEDSEKMLGFIEQKLPEYFGVLPKAKLTVKRVEAFREQDGAAQHYYPGTPDGSRPGIYYAHLSDMRAMPKNEMEAIAYHEGSPGHHMQISIAQELDSVPEFRKQAGFTAYQEGWALYAELLAKEMGAYQDPYNDFGRLITEIWRGVRLVVDTGLHAKGWTEDQAVAYFKSKTPIAEGAVRSEVQRYLVIPGQATSYKIGMIKIQELRAMATEELGSKFDIRDFHDTILAGGALPLELLERRVKTWIETTKLEDK